MNQDQQNVREFHLAMIKAGAGTPPDPDRPTMPSLAIRILRANLLWEENLETIQKGLGLEPSVVMDKDGRFVRVDFIDAREPNLVELADGIADIKYIAHGTALVAGIDMEPVDAEVHRSNMTKFLDGSFREDGKYVKGPGYSKADIASIIAAQSAPTPIVA